MLISQDDIKNYLSQVPPVPESAMAALKALKEGDLRKAALEAEKFLSH